MTISVRQALLVVTLFGHMQHRADIGKGKEVNNSPQ